MSMKLKDVYIYNYVLVHIYHIAICFIDTVSYVLGSRTNPSLARFGHLDDGRKSVGVKKHWQKAPLRIQILVSGFGNGLVFSGSSQRVLSVFLFS